MGVEPFYSAGEPALITIGDIVVTPDHVLTPQGQVPTGSVHWTFTDMSRTYEAIPTWAIVLAVVFAVVCLLGLLFLLAKESRTTGFVQVGVHGPDLYHAVQLPVGSRNDVVQYWNMVEYARSVSAQRHGW